jgi:hypothetical protein
MASNRGLLQQISAFDKLAKPPEKTIGLALQS